MQFWIRHLVLLALCVVLPFGAAIYFDTHRELDRATAAGLARARIAGQGLKTQLELQTHKELAKVISVASEIEDRDILHGLERSGSRGEASFIALRELLDQVAGAHGFAWYADPEGRVLVENGLDAIPAAPRTVLGHPLFVETQHGFALDGPWSDEGALTWVYAAPLNQDGVAAGAVLVGRKIGDDEVRALAMGISGDVTLAKGEDVQATTLPRPVAGEVRLATAETTEPVAAGRLEDALPSTTRLPFLPILFDPHAEGVAFASIATPIQGVTRGRWVVSVNATSGLEQVGARQEVLFGAMFATLLLALLIGLMNSRTFVRPIDTLEAHLSQIQLGRGDFELPERRVSGPFRRLVRLINMTVQKMPARALGSMGTSDGLNTSTLAKPRLSVPRPPDPPVPSSDTVPAVSSLDSSPAIEGLELPSSLGSVEAMSSLIPPAPSVSPSPMVSIDLSSLAPEPDAMPTPLPFPVHEDESDDDDEIAEAIASLEHQLSVPPRRRANEIRGAMPYSLEAIEGFSSQDIGPRGLRTGGSLELGNAGLRSTSQMGDADDFKAEATVVAPVQEDLLAKSARDDLTDAHIIDPGGDSTAVASVSADLLMRSAGVDGTGMMLGMSHDGLDAADQAHFKEVYERFIEMRRRCGETTQDLGFDRFMAKLTRNRQTLVRKYACRTVRFQVYEKDGRAALKATPVRAR